MVDEFGTAPYWLGSTTLRTAGLTWSVTTQSSATFDKPAVSAIGLRSFLRSITGFFVGKGETSAIFKGCVYDLVNWGRD